MPVFIWHIPVLYGNECTDRDGFGRDAFFDLLYTALNGNSAFSKNNGSSFWNFLTNSRLSKFRKNVTTSSRRVVNSVRQSWKFGVINCTAVIGRSKLTILATVDARSSWAMQFVCICSGGSASRGSVCDSWYSSFVGLCHNNILLNLIVIDFLKFNRLRSVCCMNW